MKYSTQYYIFPATFHVISRKNDYLWDSVKQAPSCPKWSLQIYCTYTLCSFITDGEHALQTVKYSGPGIFEKLQLLCYEKFKYLFLRVAYPSSSGSELQYSAGSDEQNFRNRLQKNSLKRKSQNIGTKNFTVFASFLTMFWII